MNPFSDRGATVGVYCVAKTFDGDFLVDVMSVEEIVKIRKAAKQDYVWSAWPDEMAKKAIIKRASKQWPKTDRHDRLDRAIAVVNEYEGSEDFYRKEKDITPDPITVTTEEVECLRNAMTVAGVTDEQFCNHKAIKIARIEELPRARLAGAISLLKKFAGVAQ